MGICCFFVLIGWILKFILKFEQLVIQGFIGIVIKKYLIQPTYFLVFFFFLVIRDFWRFDFTFPRCLLCIFLN